MTGRGGWPVAALVASGLAVLMAANAVAGIVFADLLSGMAVDAAEQFSTPGGSRYRTALVALIELSLLIGWLAWLAVALVLAVVAVALLHGRGWARITGMVAASIGLLSCVPSAAAYLIVDALMVPLPLFAWLGQRDGAQVSGAGTALAAVGFLGMLVDLGGLRRRVPRARP